MSDNFKQLEKNVVDICQQTIGRDVLYTPVLGAPTTIKGVYDNAFIEVLGVTSLKPVLRINLNDLITPPAKGDTVTIDSVIYKVTESRPDGFGGSLLILMK